MRDRIESLWRGFARPSESETTTWEDRGLLEDVMARSVDDWVYPAEIEGIAARTGLNDREAVRALSIGLVAEAIVKRLLIAGEVSASGFVPWECSPSAAVERIVEEWMAWGESQLTPGAIVWLAPTETGERLGRAVLRREGND